MYKVYISYILYHNLLLFARGELVPDDAGGILQAAMNRLLKGVRPKQVQVECHDGLAARFADRGSPGVWQL